MEPTSPPVDILDQVDAEREAHRRRVLRAYGVVVVLFCAAAYLGGGSLVTPRLLVPLGLMLASGAVAVVAAWSGRVTLGFVIAVVGASSTIFDAHAFLRVSVMAPAYGVLFVTLGATLLSRRHLGWLTAVLIAVAVAMRIARGEGPEPWFPTTLDAVTLTGGVAVVMLVDRQRVDRDRQLLRDALVALRDVTDVARRSADAAREASAAKSQFLARVSHELRTPLNAILGYGEIVLEEPDATPAIREDVERIVASGRSLLRLVDDVLDLSRVEAGRLELVLERISLAELIGPVVDTAAVLVRRNRNRLEVELGAGAVTVDAGRVRQIVLNLVSNAARFTADGTVALAAHVHDDTLTIVVRDTGIGIRADRLPHLFEPFVQAEADTAHRFGGTGLGLAIVDRFVRAMGGAVAVVSEVGVGSRFEVSVPGRTAGRS